MASRQGNIKRSKPLNKKKPNGAATSDDSAPPARPGEKLHSSIAVSSAWVGPNTIVCRSVKDTTFDTVLSLLTKGAETVGKKEKIQYMTGGTLHFYVKDKEAGQKEDEETDQKEDEEAAQKGDEEADQKENENPNEMPDSPYSLDILFSNSEDEKSDNDEE